jgi:4Fe-4S dicluster domain
VHPFNYETISKNIGTSLELISWELLTIWEILLYGIINVISNRENGTPMTPAVWLTVMLIPFAMARILIERVRDTYLTLSPVSCTACRYCMPCPNGVDIPRIFEFYNEAVTYGEVVRRRRMYIDPNMIKDEQRADKCIKCEQRIEKCPQKMAIPEILEKAHAYLLGKD